MNKIEVLDHADNLIYGGMTRKELSCLYDISANKTVLELGSMIGRSSYVIASVAKSVYCVDLWSETFGHLDDPIQIQHYKYNQPKNIYDLFIDNCRDFIDSGKLKMCRSNTKEAADIFPPNYFDIIFIDADHSYSGVSTDYALYKDKLKEDGYFVFHDYGHEILLGISRLCNELISKNELRPVVRAESLVVLEKVKRKPEAFFVVSNFNNNVDWIENYTTDYIVYDKSNTLPKTDKIFEVENVGYNVYDICNFIVLNYENLPELTAFLQGNPFDHCSKEKFDKLIYNECFTPLESYEYISPTLKNKTDENGGFLELNTSWYLWLKEPFSHKWYHSYYQFLEDMFVNPDRPEWVRFAPGAQYIVPKENILKYSLKFWDKLMKMVSYSQLPMEAFLLERALYTIFSNKFEEKEIK